MNDLEKMLEELQKQAMGEVLEQDEEMDDQLLPEMQGDFLSALAAGLGAAGLGAVGEMQGAILQQGMEAFLAEGLDSLFDFDDEDDEDDEAMLAFLQANKVPEELEKYLLFGAMLITTNGEPFQTMAVAGDAGEFKEAIEEAWGVSNAKEGLETLDWLMDEGHTARYGQVFADLMAGKFDDYDEEAVEEFQACVEILYDVLELPEAKVRGCKTMRAWDLDRAAYLARIFAHLGYMTEEEAWQWLEKVAAEAKTLFADWEEYFISLLIGRFIAMAELSQLVFGVAMAFLSDDYREDYLNKYPLASV